MPDRVEFALLETFRQLFEGTTYKHRDSSLGDLVASQLYEDLVTLNRSMKLAARVQAHERVVNLANRAIGRPSRRGDGTFSKAASAFDEFQVLRFRATNTTPFPFEWVDYEQTAKEYSALLVRVSREYDRRFP